MPSCRNHLSPLSTLSQQSNNQPSSISKAPYNFNTESAPLVPLNSKTDFDYYTTTKAIADLSILQANNPPPPRTCCLRICPIYGERDNQMIPGCLKVMNDGQHRTQIGPNTQLMGFLSVSNAARAHVLAFHALRSPSSSTALKVDGEASTSLTATPNHSGPSLARYG
jgi:sterol-4alpha-carboxylate 3-dehydrogenase (decarboxylating)